MADVFISYAREDIEFVRRMHEELTDQNREIWVDWEGIPPRAEWLAEIRAAIDSAESFVFVISPDSVVSQICKEELQHAVERNKRIVPIIRREVETESVDESLAKLNWIFFRDSDQFDNSIEQLSTALDTDLELVREHTRILVRAVEWVNQERNRSYTLRGRDLKDAESWLTRSSDSDPKPTSLQTQYVLASRKAKTMRQGITLGAIAFGLIVAVVLSLVAYFQNQERLRQEKIALARQLVNQAEALQDMSPDSLKKSVRKAVKSLALFNELGMYSVNADLAVRTGMALLPSGVAEHSLELWTINVSAFDPSGRFLVIVHGRNQILLWDTMEQLKIDAWTEVLPSMVSVLAVAVSVDGKYIVTLTYNANPNIDSSIVTVWQVPERKPYRQFKMSGRLEKMRLSPQGRYLYILMPGGLWGRDIIGGERLQPFSGEGYIYDLDFSPDDNYMAIAFRKSDTRDFVVRISDVEGAEEKTRWLQKKRIHSLRWTSDSQRILIKAQSTMQIHDALTGRQVASYPQINTVGYPQKSSEFIINTDGRLLAERIENYNIQIRSTQAEQELFYLNHSSEVKSMAFRPDGNSFVTLGLVDKKIRIWRLGSRSFADLHHNDSITQLVFSSDSKLLFTQSASQERSWVLPPKNKVLQSPRESTITAPSPNLRQYQVEASGWPLPQGEENCVDILNIKEKHLSSLEFTSPVLAAAINRDGNRLAIATGTITRGGWKLKLETWDANRRERLGVVPYSNLLEDKYAGFLEFSYDDRFVISASRVGFTLWDAEKLTQAGTIYHKAPQTIALQPNGKLIATLGGDQKIRIWELPNMLEIAQIEQSERLKEIALSSDGRWLVTLGEDGVASLWVLQPDDLIAQACAHLRNPCP